MVMERNYDPVIVFSFSKRECEAYAMQMAKLDFTTPEVRCCCCARCGSDCGARVCACVSVQEKKLIEQVYSNAVDSLADDDKKLPQVESILPLLQRGIGIHHGGLLPLIKEVIEILFQESLVKCLFATETFAMGINMPAKTVRCRCVALCCAALRRTALYRAATQHVLPRCYPGGVHRVPQV